MSSIKLFLADDHVLVRRGLAAIIKSFDGYEVVGEANNGKEMIEKIENGILPDIVLLDLGMPEMDGYEAAAWLKENYPSVKILVLTMYDSDLPVVRLMQNGVRGFMKKDIVPEDLKKAIDTVMANGYYYPEEINDRLAAFLSGLEKGSKKNFLTDQELSFMKLAATDMTYKAIASHLQISPKVADHLREDLFAKLGVESRVTLAMYAIRNGLINQTITKQ